MNVHGVEIKWFGPEEFTDVTTMHLPLLTALDELREYIARPIRIHESNPIWFPDTSHVKGSAHYLNRAVDCSCSAMPLWEFFLAATRIFALTGIGVYPAWNTPGIHVEIREDIPRRKYWWRDEVGVYKAITVHDLSIFTTLGASYT